MVLQKILPLIIFPSILCYHFYNPSTNDILTQPSLNDIPPGYKLLPPPITNKKNIHTRRGKVNQICTDAGFTCITPYAKSLTFQFECDQDDQCPATYKCCQQKCFVHKICSKSTSTGSSPNGNNNFHRPGSCEKWPYNCQIPYQYSLTSIFKCDNDRQCPRGFKCCEQNCFLHKICSRATARYSISDDRFKPTTIKYAYKVTTTSTERSTTIRDLVTNEPEIPNYEINPEAEEEDMEGEEDTEDEDLTVTKENEEDYDDNDDDDNADTEETTVSFNSTNEIQTQAVSIEVSTNGFVDMSTSEASLDVDTDLKSFIDKASKTNLTGKGINGTKGTHDANAINPEYAAYYYHYGNGNDTDDDYDEYDDDEEEEEE